MKKKTKKPVAITKVRAVDDIPIIGTKEYGGRFFKRVEVYMAFSSVQEMLCAMAKEKRAYGREEIFQFVDFHREFLKTKGLPNTDNVQYDENLNIIANSDQSTTVLPYNSSKLMHFIIQVLGYEYDSLEGLSARIISEANFALAAFENRREDALSHMFRFGEAVAYWNVYNALAQIVRKPRASRRNLYLLNLIRHLTKSHPTKTIPHLFNIISSTPTTIEIDGIEIDFFKEGEKLFVEAEGTSQSFSLRAFQGYASIVLGRKNAR